MAASFDKSDYKKGLWPYMIAQAQGAFSDFMFRSMVVFTLIREAGATNDPAKAGTITSIAAMLFAVPFFLAPAQFGAISDRFSKKSVAIAMKYFEIVIMAFAGIAFYTAEPVLLWGTLFLLAVHSAQFGSCKYGLIPECVPEEKLSSVNGMVQGSTMIAVVAGGALAGPLFVQLYDRNAVYMISPLLVALSIGGLFAARRMFSPPAAHPGQGIPLNPYQGLGEHVRLFWKDRWLGLAILIYTFFWGLAQMVSVNLYPFGYTTLGIDESKISLILASVSLGIGTGSIMSGQLSRGKVEPGLVPLGIFGVSLCSLLLSVHWYNFWGALLLHFGIGFFGGMFDVPSAAMIQQRSNPTIRGRIVTTSNLFTWVAIGAAGGVYFLFAKTGFDPTTIYLITGVSTLAFGAFVMVAQPLFFLRTVLWLMANTVYRIRVFGRTNIPEVGGALLVANHTSFLDALVIMASIDRRVRFVMHRGEYDVPWIKPLARIMGAIPVSTGGGPREVVQSLRSATESLSAGDLVCIFAEGQITRSGQMMPFRKGFDRIMKGVEAPIIPVHVDNVWGTLFRFVEGKFLWKWPNRIPFPIMVGFGRPMAPDSNAYQLRAAIQELGTEAYSEPDLMPPMLHRQFVSKARRHPFQMLIADARSGQLTALKTLAGSIILARKLQPMFTKDEEMIGLLLPQSVGATLTNVALTFMGKAPVNLNYTASAEAITGAAQQCKMKHVITSRAFLEQMPVVVPGEAIYLEDVMKTVEKRDRIRALLAAIFMPVHSLERSLGAPESRSPNDLATVIFSSGSEGEPKGVMLTHYNVSKNIEAAMQVFPHKKGDCLVGMLPFFHSFGYTATLWLALTSAHFRVFFHPNPLESRAIGELIQKYKGTIMFSTSTFLHGFIRRCTPEQMASLRFVITGAEKLAPRVRDAFKEKFGIEPLEGYGTTECSPIVSLNLPDVRAPGFYLKGTKRGSIGLPLPGISVRIVDPDTREILQNGRAGVLMVKGPNVMRGYLGRPEKTNQVLQDGWYETGDISTIDEDGFITITDRLARFSKIGGEMVSHTKIEDEMHKVLNETERKLAVAGVPDENKGERLVVLHTLTDEEFDKLLSKMDETGLPNLWIPKAKAFYKVELIPILGSGKMDIKAVKELARKLDVGE